MFERVPFLNVVEDVSGGNIKIPQSEYLPSGAVPVVDQSARLIAGYTDNFSAIHRTAGPVIVFGDHTRTFKFVDHSFAMGADGVKVLRPTSRIDPKFLYHFLRSVEVPSAGYSRHYKFLKEIQVPLPPIDEQQRIAAILDSVDEIRVRRGKQLGQMLQAGPSLYETIDSRMARNEIPWTPAALEDLVDPGRKITYGILKPGPDIATGVPYVRVVDLKSEGIDASTVRRTTPKIAQSYVRSTVRAGDLLISIRGHVGRFGVVPEDLDGANITQDSARIAISDPVLATFTRAAMESGMGQQWMARRTRGAAVQGLNLGDLRLFPLRIPSRDVLQSFGAAVDATQTCLRQIRRSQLQIDELTRSLQSRAFRGEL